MLKQTVECKTHDLVELSPFLPSREHTVFSVIIAHTFYIQLKYGNE